MGRDVFLRMNHSWKTHQLVIFFFNYPYLKAYLDEMDKYQFQRVFRMSRNIPSHPPKQAEGCWAMSELCLQNPQFLNYYFISIVFFIFQHNIRIFTKPIDVNFTLYFICPKRLVYSWFFRWHVNCVSKSRFWKPFELCFEILFVCIFINSCRYIRKKGIHINFRLCFICHGTPPLPYSRRRNV